MTQQRQWSAKTFLHTAAGFLTRLYVCWVLWNEWDIYISPWHLLCASFNTSNKVERRRAFRIRNIAARKIIAFHQAFSAVAFSACDAVKCFGVTIPLKKLSVSRTFQSARMMRQRVMVRNQRNKRHRILQSCDFLCVAELRALFLLQMRWNFISFYGMAVFQGFCWEFSY